MACSAFLAIGFVVLSFVNIVRLLRVSSTEKFACLFFCSGIGSIGISWKLCCVGRLCVGVGVAGPCASIISVSISSAIWLSGFRLSGLLPSSCTTMVSLSGGIAIGSLCSYLSYFALERLPVFLAVLE